MHSAAPASASRRSAIGTVPAWPAMPVSFAASRVAPAYRRHHADGKVLLLQHRPLLDVQFDIGMQFAARPRRRTDMIGIEAELHHRLAHRDAAAVARVEHALVEGARDRPAAEQGGGKPHALLVGKAGDFDRERQPHARAGSGRRRRKSP